jgi:regulator of sigma E protease
MSLLVTVIAFFLVLGPLVFFHELGHFLFAKLGRIRVLEFGFGYPPRAWKFWQSPGRVTIAGVRLTIPRNFKAPLAKADAIRLFKKPESKDKSAGFGFLDQLPLPTDVMQAMEDGRFAEATFAPERDGSRVLQSIKLLNPEVDDVQERLGTTTVRGPVSAFVPGTEYTLNWMPVGGFTRMLGEEDPTAPDSFAAAPKRWRALTLAAGPGMNLLLAFALFVIMFMSGSPEPNGPVFVSYVKPGTPADKYGLKPNDVILTINGQAAKNTVNVSALIRAHLGEEITLSIQRDSQALDLRATPRREGEFDAAVEGPLGIGIGMTGTVSYDLHYYSLPEAVPLGLEATAVSIGGTVMAPVAILRGLVPLSAARPVGPVGIAQIAGAEVEASMRVRGLFPILQLAGFLSVAIGLTNLLPLPALDGGRLLFILVELVRRRRIDPKKETIVHLVGMALLLTLMVVITLQDILNPISIPRTF